MIAKIKDNPKDPAGILVGAIIEVLAILHVPEKLGLGPEEVAHLGGLLIIIAATLRFIFENKNKNKETPVAQAPAIEEPEVEEIDEDERETPVEPTPVIAPPPKTGGN